MPIIGCGQSVKEVCLCFGAYVPARHAGCLPAIIEGREEGDMKTQFLTDLGKC